MEWVSPGVGGAVPNNQVLSARISRDGRWVAFRSEATNIVPGDVNGFMDIFVRDRLNGTTVLASITAWGSQVPGGTPSNLPYGISDGGVVAFSSQAALIATDTNLVHDVFVRDVVAGTTERVSESSSGVQATQSCYEAAISADARFVAFTGNAQALFPALATTRVVFLKDRQSGQLSIASVTPSGAVPNDQSFHPCVSSDGRFVGFTSLASDLVPGDTNAASDCFVRDVQTNTTRRVSLANGGVQAVGYDLTSISDDGRYAGFLGWNNRGLVYDSTAMVLEYVEHPFDGSPLDPSGLSTSPDLSSDGRYAVFMSTSKNLVPGDTNAAADVFRLDRATLQTQRVSVAANGSQGDHQSGGGSVSGDGSTVAFHSLSSLVAGTPSGGPSQVFARECVPPVATVYCTAKTNSLNCVPAIGSSGTPSASSGSGFTITASNVLNQKTGLLFYGVSGPQAAIFQGGYMCVAPPTRRTPLQQSGGNAPPANDCSGQFALDFNAHVASGVDPALVEDQPVWVQCWSRDPASPSTTSLSNALMFVIGA